MEWKPICDAPIGNPLFVVGFPLEPYSMRRGPRGFSVAYQAVPGEWHIIGSRDSFEPIGWLPIPDSTDDVLPQASAPGQPKYQVGQKVKFSSRHDGVVEVKIEAVIDWPSGWWYALDRVDNPGHGNPSVGTDCLWIDESGVFGRPARESELYLLSEEDNG